MRGVLGVVRRNSSCELIDVRLSQSAGIAPGALCCAFKTADAALFAFGTSAKPGVDAPASAEPFVASGVIRNRLELAADFGVNAATFGDDELLVKAYRRWGPECCKRIYGDWCLAVWNAERRELFLARDHHGNTALYYHVTDDAVGFATSLPLLLALRLGPIALDQLYLAQVLVSWTAYHGERTALMPIKRVRPGHYVTITPVSVTTHRYWRLDDVEPLRLPTREDYVAGFRDVFDTAVGESLSGGSPATTLSCGLDSGAVTVTAAQMLARKGRRLAAYISVPVAEFRPFIAATRIGDELPLAQITATAAGNVDLAAVRGGRTPIAAIRRALEILPAPQHAPSNYYWMQEIYETAAADGHSVMLTGQSGNSGVSWLGDAFSQPLSYQIRRLGLLGWIKRRTKQMLPPRAVWAFRDRTQRSLARTAIRPEFAADLRLFERRQSDPAEAPYRTSLQVRCDILKAGNSMAGDIHAAHGAAAGIFVTDPTADPRVLEFCLSVPDHIFIDPETGTDRWLIRSAMRGRLPDEVRLNRKRGIQAADLVPRLRACREEVEDALEECANGAAADYLDVPYMRRVWQRIQSEENGDVFRLAITVLTRGIMAGLFVNGIGKRY